MGVVLHIIQPCNIVIREEIAIQYMHSEAYMRGCCITRGSVRRPGRNIVDGRGRHCLGL